MYRYAADGTFAGDTWHESIPDAKKQAEFEYAAALSEWKEVPPNVKDAVEFALRNAGSN